jgi:hypothetical protein
MKKRQAAMRPRRHQTAKHHRRQPVSVPRAPAKEPPCYRCSKCGLTENRALTIPRSDDYPSACDLRGVSLWQTCPDEGPEGLRLWDPEEPKTQRIRYTFSYGEFKSRVCSPFVRDSRGASLAASVSYGPACSPSRMQFEWFIQEFIKRRGAANDVDLANLLPAHRVLSERAQGISQDADGHWLLSPPRSQRMEEWLNEAFSPGVPLPRLNSEELFKVVQVLFEAAERTPHQAHQSRQATVYVPVDLRYAMTPQWEQQIHYLGQVQSHLLALSGRKNPFEVSPPTIARRLRYFVLERYAGLKSHQIAQLVLGDSARSTTVRKELGRLRRFLSEHDIRV